MSNGFSEFIDLLTRFIRLSLSLPEDLADSDYLTFHMLTTKITRAAGEARVMRTSENAWSRHSCFTSSIRCCSVTCWESRMKKPWQYSIYSGFWITNNGFLLLSIQAELSSENLFDNPFTKDIARNQFADTL